MSISDKTSYLIAILATTIRYYDYALFGLSASVIADNFMPGSDNSDRLLNFFIIFFISMNARPLGSIIFGRISDKIGRTVSVRITTIISSLSVIIIAILPSYKILGFTATVILLVSRMFFIMSLAGEIDAIKIYVVEKIGRKSRHLASATVSFFSQIGVLIAASMYNFTLGLTEINWLWRINFLVGGIFGVVIFFLRKSLRESIYFKKSLAKYQKKQGKVAFIKNLSKNKLKFVLALLLSGGIGASYNFLIIFLGTFISKVLGVISLYEATQNNIILITTYAISCLISGFFADKISDIIYKQIFISLFFIVVLIFIIYWLSRNNIFLFSLHMGLVFLVPIYMVPIQIKIQSIFPVDIRVRMISLSHSLGSIILSSTIPSISIFIWKYTKNFSMICLYFLFIVLLIFSSVFVIMKAKYKNMLEE